MPLKSGLRKGSAAAIAISAIAASLVVVAAGPALAVGTVSSGSNFVGKSWQDASSGDVLCAFTLEYTGTDTVSVQARSAGVVTGTKVSGSHTANVNTGQNYYLPGGKHWGGGNTWNS
jgi:hypothetical protein